MKRIRGCWLLTSLLPVTGLAGVFVTGAAAHSSISPPVAKTQTLQQFGLEVQAEKEDVRTNRVEVTFPEGFNVESFPAAPGWRLNIVTQGTGEEAPVQRVAWIGGEKSPSVDPVFHFTATLQSAKTYAVKVRQVYEDGSLTDWAGPENSEEPAAFVEGVTSFGGGNGNTTLAIIALALGALGVILGIAALLVRGGSRPLT